MGTILLLIGWMMGSHTPDLRWMFFSFITIYFLLYNGASCFYSLIRREQTEPQDLGLLFTVSAIYAVSGFGLLHNALGEYPGAFPFAVAVFYGLLCATTWIMARENRTLREAALALGVLFATITIPVQLHQGWIAIGWSMESAVLVTLGLRLRSPLLHRAGQIVWILSWAVIVWAAWNVEPIPSLLFVNARALPLLIGSIATGWMAYLSYRMRGTNNDGLASVYAVVSMLGGAWLLAQELSLYCFQCTGISMSQCCTCSVSCLWAIYACAGVILGLRARHAALRWTGYLLLIAALIPAIGTGVDTVLQPFWNARCLSLLFAAAMMAGLCWVLARRRDRLHGSESGIIEVLSNLASVVVLGALTYEIYGAFSLWGVVPLIAWPNAALFTIASFWMIYSVAILLLGHRLKMPGMRIVAHLMCGIGIVLLAIGSSRAAALPWMPIVNLRFASFLIATASIAAFAIVSRRNEEGIAPHILVPIAAAILLWGMTQETYESCRYYQAALGSDWSRAGQMGMSLVWTVFGVILLVGGIIRRYQPIRLMALGLLGITALKVFLLDLGYLATPYRILSFGGLGLALIGISWLYSRFGVGRERSALQ